MGIIRLAMDSIESETCVRFRPRKYAKDYINIFSGRFCKSNLGRIGGQQDLSLNKVKCMQKGVIIHELLHALGFIHMHSRPNRDKYVKILWQNINPIFFREFDRVNPHRFNYYGTPYDYQSIMHYGSTAATKNGGRTIMTRDEKFIGDIGQRAGLSEGDINRINTKYGCHKAFKHKPSFNLFTKHTFYQRDDDRHNAAYQVVEEDDKLFSRAKHRAEEEVEDDNDDDLFNI